MEYKIPYGNGTLDVEVPKRNLLAYTMPRKVATVDDVDAAVERAMQNPIGSKRIKELVTPESKVAVMIDNFKRPTPSWAILRVLMDHLKKAGVKKQNIIIVMGSGVHKYFSKAEVEAKVGKEIANEYPVIQHTRLNKCAFIGVTPESTPVWINAEAAKADVKISAGIIEFNRPGGFTGGAKMIVPGIASWETIAANHRLGFSPTASRTGLVDSNVCRKDMESAGRLANLNFVIDVVMHPQGGVASVTAGDFVAEHRAGVKVCRDICEIPVPSQADILITSVAGHQETGVQNYLPSEGTAYITAIPWIGLQLIGGLKKGGTMILSAKPEWPQHPFAHRNCPWWKQCEDHFICKFSLPPEEVMRQAFRGAGDPQKSDPAEDQEIMGWQSCAAYWTSKMLHDNDVFLVSPDLDANWLKGTPWKYARSLDEALDWAIKKHGDDSKVIVNPYGSVVPQPQTISHPQDS
jgi:hypothetical protein